MFNLTVAIFTGTVYNTNTIDSITLLNVGDVYEYETVQICDDAGGKGKFFKSG